jgi:hypothetical protein
LTSLAKLCVSFRQVRNYGKIFENSNVSKIAKDNKIKKLSGGVCWIRRGKPTREVYQFLTG